MTPEIDGDVRFQSLRQPNEGSADCGKLASLALAPCCSESLVALYLTSPSPGSQP
ncbi:hypothetical protein LEMLEM_LOCUS16760 [Lemmus lemmus]